MVDILRENKKICYIATIPAVVHTFLREHIQASAAKWSVKVVSSSQGAELLNDLSAEFMPLEIERKISPFKDLLTLIRLTTMFRREKFDLVHSIMPKTGLLTMLAGRMAGVPIRVHTFTGQVWANKRGWKRNFLKIFDRLTVFFATHILIDSFSQRDFLIAEGVVPEAKGTVIGKGSICGVDLERFRPDENYRKAIRSELNISSSEIVILFVGRLNVDKGIPELAQAFSMLAERHADVVLLLVGAEEDFSFERVQQICRNCSDRLRRIPFTSSPEHYMAAADIFCLPSHREGFGQAIIEAAACGVPAVATNIYGITDAIEEGSSGLLSPPGDIPTIVQLLETLIENPTLRRSMGVAARDRVQMLFPSSAITEAMMIFYGDLLDA